jgi:NAD(P)-dependent dehydrogenase (short-subunit alcohol dehydrogenase family)
MPPAALGLLSGKHILVTGASGSIGAAISRVFAASGGLITLVGRNPLRLSQVQASLSPFQPQPQTQTLAQPQPGNSVSSASSIPSLETKPSHGLSHRVHVADVSKWEEVKRMVGESVVSHSSLEVFEPAETD